MALPVHGPGLSAQLFGTTNVIVSAIGIVAVGGAGALAQLLFGRSAPWLGASGGSIALAGGMALIVTAAATDSSATYLIGSILGGVGFGVAFLGGLSHARRRDPAGASCGSAFGLLRGGLPVRIRAGILAGLVVGRLGLQVDVRDLRQRRRRDRARSRLRGVAHAAGARTSSLRAAPATARS